MLFNLDELELIVILINSVELKLASCVLTVECHSAHVLKWVQFNPINFRASLRQPYYLKTMLSAGYFWRHRSAAITLVPVFSVCADTGSSD